jgi:hypothetical protein
MESTYIFLPNLEGVFLVFLRYKVPQKHQKYPNFHFALFTPTSRTSGYSQKEKYDRHPNQETKVVWAPVIMHLVHLYIWVNK